MGRVVMRVSTFLFALACLSACGAALPGASAPTGLTPGLGEQMPVLFGTATCPYCARARAWFKAQNIRFIDCDVDSEELCYRNYAILRAKLGVRGVPAFLHKGQVWSGYSPDQMAEIAGAGADPGSARSPALGAMR